MKMLIMCLFISTQVFAQSLQVTTLIENTSVENRDDLKAEHGISLYIEYDDKNILFDVGRTDSFIRNAAALNLSISDVDILVISHAHIDHGGALKYFLEKNTKAKIYMHLNADKEYFFKQKHYIGLDQEVLARVKDRITYVSEYTEISEGVSLIAGFDEKYIKPHNKVLYMSDGKLDNMEHELVMVIEREKLTVFTGCSHNGILNMVDAVIKQYPDENIDAVIGGFHLQSPGSPHMSETKEAVTKIAETFLQLPVDAVYTGHCTGVEAFNVLKDVLGNKLMPFKTGSSLTL